MMSTTRSNPGEAMPASSPTRAASRRAVVIGGRCLAAAGLAVHLALASPAAVALPFTAAVGILSGRGPGETVEFPAVAEAEQILVTQPGTGATRNMYARASSLGLGVRVIDEFTATVPEAEAIIDIPDLVFSSLFPTVETHAVVGFGGLLDGVVTFGGTGNAGGVLVVSATLLGTGVSAASPASYNATFAKDREAGTARPLPTGPVVVHEQLTGSAQVELGRPVQFAASMFLRAGGDSAFGFFGPGVISALFDNSFEFDPLAFFDLPDGITANSASLGLVDNRLIAFAGPVSAAAPGPAALLCLGLVVLAWAGGRRPSACRAVAEPRPAR